MSTTPQVAIIMGSDSDLNIMSQAGDVLKEFEVSFELRIISAHRTPKEMVQYAQEAKERGIKVIIAGAGGAAHLPGMTASLTTLPVIGVPVSLQNLDGLDSLLSIVQMPKGVPVASVAIDNAKNAAYLALRILGIEDETISRGLLEFAETQKEIVTSKDKKLQ
jgi:5-(carboxyamino)imidazole ribonucleotide mutase